MASAPVISAAAMMLGIRRYELRLGGAPMQTSSPAKRTCSDSRSASEYTAPVSSPSSRHARMTRRAISPRLAMRTFLNTPGSAGVAGRAGSAVGEEDLPNHQGVRSSARGADESPVISVNFRSDAESTPDTR